MRAPDRRARLRPWTMALVSLPPALLALGAAQWAPSHAAFSATATNPDTRGSSWAAGTVVVTDQLGGLLDWSLSDLKPGSFNEMCVRVYYEGSLPADVRLYVAPGDSTGDLDPYSHLTIEEGTGGGGAIGSTSTSCNGFATGSGLFDGFADRLVDDHASFAGGIGSWDGATTSTYRTYRFHSQIRAGLDAQGRSGSIRFTWEARST